MDYITALRYCVIVSTLSALGVLVLIVYLYESKRTIKKFNKVSIYQKEIERYFRLMRWFNYEDEEIADMLFRYHHSYKELKEANNVAEREIKKRK